MPKLALATATGALVVAILAVEGAVAQTALANYPLAIMCRGEQIARVGYLYEIKRDGSATYITPDGRLSVTLNVKGVLEKPPNRAAAGDCFGKTVDQLRANGNLIERP